MRRRDSVLVLVFSSFHPLPFFIGHSGVLDFAILILSLVFSYLPDLRLAVRARYILGVLFNFCMFLFQAFAFRGVYVQAFFLVVSC